MKGILAIGGFGIIAAFVFLAFGADSNQDSDGNADAILKLHKELIEAHKNNDVGELLASESDEILVVSRGEVLFQTRNERVQLFERYLQSTEFDEYRDLIDPIVRVSTDGTLGWLIAQVAIVGNRTESNGERTAFDSVWAWIELYEKKNGRWYRVGEVSNVRPDNS